MYSTFFVIARYSLQSPTFLIAHPCGASFDIGFNLSYKGSLASSYFITFYSSIYSPSTGSGLSQVVLPFFKRFWEKCTQLSNEDKNSKLGTFHSSAAYIYFLSSALTLYIVLGTIWQAKLILINWHFNKWDSFPGKNGLLKTFLSKFPENVYLIFRAILTCCGVIVGSSRQLTYNRLVATQKVILLTPVPFGSTSGGNSPSYAASAGD